MKAQAVLASIIITALIVLMTVFLMFNRGFISANLSIREPLKYKIMYIIESKSSWSANELAEEIIKKTYSVGVKVEIITVNLLDKSVVSRDQVETVIREYDPARTSMVIVDYTRVLENNMIVIYHVEAYRVIVG